MKDVCILMGTESILLIDEFVCGAKMNKTVSFSLKRIVCREVDHFIECSRLTASHKQ